MYPALIFVQGIGGNSIIEFVGIGNPTVEYLLETAERILCLGGAKTQPESLAASAGHLENIVGRGLGPRFRGIQRLARGAIGGWSNGLKVDAGITIATSLSSKQ